MPEMKNSNIEWIGEIPSEWKIAKVSYLCNKVFAGGTPDTTKLEFWDGDIPWLPSGSCKDRYILSFEKTITNLGYHSSSTKLIPENTALIAMTGATCASVGYTTFETCANQSVTAFITKEDYLFSKYLFYSLIALKGEILSHQMGGAQAGINVQDCKNIVTVLPPLDTQKCIANFLDQKCSEIDSLSADIQSQIDVLEEYKKSVITEAVTKGLNHDVEMKNSGIEWAQRIPEHWGVMPNKFVMKKEKMLCSKYTGEDILSLTMNGVIVRDLDAGGKMPASFDGYQVVRPNNLLMCLFDYDVTPRCIGLIKNHGLTSPAYSQFVMKNGNSERYYYYYYLMIDNTKELLHLAKNLRHSFTEEQLGMINTPVPPVDEQIAIADHLDKIITETDMVIADKKAQLETLAEYKKSLIYEYVTGKKEVPTI